MADGLEQPGLFPDGFLGRKGLLRNRGTMTELYERITGDAEASALLDNMGQSAQVDLLFEQGMTRNSRAEQQPYMSALAQIADSVGLFERDAMQFDQRFQEVSRSMLALEKNVAPDQRNLLTQLFHAAGRAADRAQFGEPGTALDELSAVESEILNLAQQASDRIRTAFVEPLEKVQVEYVQAREQLLTASNGNMDAQARPSEVVQILNLIGASTTQEFGLQVTTPIFTLGQDNVPNLTYAELLNRINSRENALTDMVRGELEQRGFDDLQSSPLRIRPTDRRELMQRQAAVQEALESTDFRGESNALGRFMSRFPEGSQLDAGQNLVKLPSGESVPVTGQALTILQRQRSGRSRRERMNSR